MLSIFLTFLIQYLALHCVNCILLNGNFGEITHIVRSDTEVLEWSIIPNSPTATSIQLILKSLNMQQAELRIYDSQDFSSGILIYVCASCGTTLPPPFFSRTGNVIITIKGVHGVSPSTGSFSLQYLSTPTSTAQDLQNVSINLNMGYASFTPLTIGGSVQAFSRQQWLINLSPGTIITFGFADFVFPTSSCDVASLVLYDGLDTKKSKVIYRGCSQTDFPMNWIYSFTGMALVMLRTGSKAIPLNFKISYFTDTTLYQCGSFLQPNLLDGISFALLDGSRSSDLMKKGLSCSWIITPNSPIPLLPNSNASSLTVTLIFRLVSIKFGASVMVYDGPTASAPVLWSGVGSTITTPPPLVSSGNSLFVTFQTDSSEPYIYTGFLADYYSNFPGSMGSGRTYSNLTMSSAIDLTPPGTGEIATTSCEYLWNLFPNNAIGPITFFFSELQLVSGERLCLFDGRSARPSSLITCLTGAQLPLKWFVTTGPNAVVKFSSRSNNTNINPIQSNFKLSYFSDGPNYHCGFPINPAVLTSPSMKFTDGSRSSEAVYPNQDCKWNLQPIGSAAVFLFFTRFNLGSGGALRIYDGPVSTGRLITSIGSNSAVPAPILVNSSSAGISYQTTGSPSGNGFAVTYFGANNSDSFPGDRMVHLLCSSVTALSLLLTEQPISRSRNLTWIVTPASNTYGRIYIAINGLFLSDPASCLSISDGSKQLLSKFCGSPNRYLPMPYRWIQSSSNYAVIKFSSLFSSSEKMDNFDLSYYSDGPNFHCGFTSNPAVLTAPSMIFSDGSSSFERMYPGQNCEWLIQPSEAANCTNVVLEFLSSDLTGGTVEVFDGPDSQSNLLWSCIGCDLLPNPLVSSQRSLFVRFSTLSRNPSQYGNGFRVVYWCLNSNNKELEKSQGSVLEIPLGATIAADKQFINGSAFHLTVPMSNSSLSFYPSYVPDPVVIDIAQTSMDGRSPDSEFLQTIDPSLFCGVVRNSDSGNLNRFVDIQQNSQTIYSSTRRLSSFLDSRSKKLLNLIESTAEPSLNPLHPHLLQSSTECKYILSSGSTRAITIEFRPSHWLEANSTLIIYGGVHGHDRVLYDSRHLAPANETLRTVDGSIKVVAPCGKAMVILQIDSSRGRNRLDLAFHANNEDIGLLCVDYKISLMPKPKTQDPWLPFYYSGGALILLIIGFVIYFYSNKQIKRHGYLFYPQKVVNNTGSSGSNPISAININVVGRRKQQVYKAESLVHPTYSPEWDHLKNMFLPVGNCVVCKNLATKVMRLKCSHGICVEDIQGYLESALGDKSMFPVKCPLFYEGCTGTIEATIAKRFLSKSNYNRFLEFLDRATYGDGMRCIFCSGYVNFPADMSNMSRVECPYCQERFCLRCRSPWHYGSRCASDRMEASLEQWTKKSGAQKCPSCRKLIEKEDPETCHHMVHKITDSIPCTRDRTDFCYLCGEEVAPDYPHVELRGDFRGANHFPDEKMRQSEKLKQKNSLKNQGQGGTESVKRGVRSPSSRVYPDDSSNFIRSSDSSSQLLESSPAAVRPFTTEESDDLDNFDQAWLETMTFDRFNIRK